MRAQSFRKILVACLVIAGLTCAAFAQEPQPPQGGGGGQAPPPTPQPNPQPQPRQPNVNPTPQPTMPSQEEVNIRGRIITGVHFSDTSIIEVRFETDGGQPIGFAYASSGGDFSFRKGGVSLDQSLFVVVNMEGFKPYRERLFGSFGRGGFDGFVNIFLERETEVSKSGKGGAAVVDLKQLRAKIPGKAVDEYEKALKESSKGNRAKAVEGLQRAIKLAPDFYEAQHSLGIQYIALQKYEDAEGALLKARDLSPKNAEPLINLGTLYYQRGEEQNDAGHSDQAAATFQKATEFLEESIRRNPGTASGHGYLGAALYKLASYERAESTLKRALELDEDLDNARLMLVNVYTKSARFPEALEQINIFLKKNPKGPQSVALGSIKQQIEKALAK